MLILLKIACLNGEICRKLILAKTRRARFYMAFHCLKYPHHLPFKIITKLEEIDKFHVQQRESKLNFLFNRLSRSFRFKHFFVSSKKVETF